MIKRRTFLTLTLLIASTALVASTYVGWQAHGNRPTASRIVQAAWKHTFESVSRMAGGVDAIVLAEAVQVRPGRIAYSDNGEDALPFEEVVFRVARGLKGAQPGSELVVERAGGRDLDDHVILLDADGGPFTLGRTYLLFLMRQEDGPNFYQVNDQARFDVEDGRLRAASPDGPVASFLHGRNLAEALGVVEDSLGGRGDAQGGNPCKSCPKNLAPGCTRVSCDPCCFQCPNDPFLCCL